MRLDGLPGPDVILGWGPELSRMPEVGCLDSSENHVVVTSGCGW